MKAPADAGAMSIASTHISDFTGVILEPGDQGYDAARAVFNGAVDRRPAVIAQARDAHDVAAAIRHARAAGLEIAVRAGGHSGAGFGVNDGGLVIDVRAMKRVEVDLDRRRVRAGAGLTWAELDAATQAHGLAVTGGRISDTGIAGLTLGSGSGWLERLVGLTSDNLVSATVVTAGGDIVRASEHEHSDLFWGLRGGGGNFGVVTEFELQLYPVGPMIIGGALWFEGERATEVIAAYRDIMESAPDELGGCIALVLAPPAPFIPAHLVGTPMVSMAVAAFGELDYADGLVAPLRELGPVVDMVGPMPYMALQSMLDQGSPAGLRNHWKAGFIDTLPDEAIETAVDFAKRIPSPFTHILIQPLGGAYARVDAADTALTHRDAGWAYHALNLWVDEADDEANRAWTTGLSDAMSPFGQGAIHPNHVSDPAGARVWAFYGPETYARLVAVKDRWDPENVFRGNQNIPPSL
jgi:FAD/FMN-containing dehydrogenase